jgi:hypothetical protein
MASFCQFRHARRPVALPPAVLTSRETSIPEPIRSGMRRSEHALKPLSEFDNGV